ncbi:hypothetical protein ILUMI_11794 [Ignelater luminosus]|uniref:Uncharacterized protein n=1 Tax=Ignelater luminosus TaxID=2038154 RepID=A0A8K0CZG4_IGNLU|nr:hypothetical protein ILUMI_11794 [Ignelater luminosus]
MSQPIDQNTYASDRSMYFEYLLKCCKVFFWKEELAKQNLLMQHSLTDEEKLHLESILSDIDSEEYAVNERTTKPCAETRNRRLSKKLTPRKVSEENQFKIQDDELTVMEDLDNKIKEMCKSNPIEINGTKCSTSDLPVINLDEDELETAEKRGRYWKHHHLQKRLQNIDKDLADIAAKDAEDKERLEKQNQQITYWCNTIRNKEEDKSDNSENGDDEF